MKIRYVDGRICSPGTIFCIGRNYTAHVAELGNTPAETPVIFCKPMTALNTSGFIDLPTFSEEVHYETELLVLLGKGGKDISREDARAHIDGFGVGLDLTARDIQKKLQAKGLPWELAKGFDGAACVSDFVPASHFPHLEDIRFRMTFNGQLRQSGQTAMMRFAIDEQIAFLSRHFTLRAGDMLFTGTPEGVGRLQSGDRLSLMLGQNLVRADFQVR